MWSGKNFGSALKYGFFRLLVRLRLIPLARMLVIPVSFYYSLRPGVRKSCSYYLKRRFPNASALATFGRCALLCYNFANVLLDRIVLGCGGDLPIRQDEDSMELIRECLKAGKGCILVSAHFGCWQNGLEPLRSLDRQVAIVQWQDGNHEEDFFRYGRNIIIVPACRGAETAVGICAILKNNGIVCIMGDRLTPGDRKKATVNFLGGRLEAPLFPYRLARLTGAPAIFTASLRKDGKICGLPAKLCPDRNAPQAFADFLEELVRKHPYNFFNFYDMWKENDKG